MTTNDAGEATFECKWCHKTFKQESRYLAHRCKTMQKQEELRSPIGQAALQYYKAWFEAQGRTVADEAFASSKMYGSFIEFAKFVKGLALPTPKRFISIMVARGIEPRAWTSDASYTMYMEYLDNVASPVELIRISVSTILSLSDRLAIDPSQFFVTISTQDVIILVQRRKLSPWIMLLSSSCVAMLRSASADQTRTLQTLVPPELWRNRFKANPEAVSTARTCIRELGI